MLYLIIISLSQKWILKTVSQQPALVVTDLKAGKASAFINVHTNAMLSLVTGSVAIVPDTTPETLLFDVPRLAIFQKEFNRIVDGATALIIANHAIIGSDKTPSEGKRHVISVLSDHLGSGGCFDATEFCGNLDCAGVLMDAAVRAKFLRSVTQSTENKDDPVRQLM